MDTGFRFFSPSNPETHDAITSSRPLAHLILPTQADITRRIKKALSHISHGKRHLTNNNLDAAEQQFNLAIAQNPRSAEAHCSLAQCALSRGDLAGSLGKLQMAKNEIMQQTPDWEMAMLYLTLGFFRHLNEENDEAIRALSSACIILKSMNDPSASIYLAETQIHLGFCYLSLNHREQASQQFTEARKIIDDFESECILNDTFTTDPAIKKLNLLQLYLKAQQGEFEKRKGCINKNNCSPFANEFAAANHFFKEILDSNTNDVFLMMTALKGLGEIQYKTAKTEDDYKNAIHYFTRLITLCEQNPAAKAIGKKLKDGEANILQFAHLYRAFAYYKLKQWDKALDDFDHPDVELEGMNKYRSFTKNAILCRAKCGLEITNQLIHDHALLTVPICQKTKPLLERFIQFQEQKAPEFSSLGSSHLNYIIALIDNMRVTTILSAPQKNARESADTNLVIAAFNKFETVFHYETIMTVLSQKTSQQKYYYLRKIFDRLNSAVRLMMSTTPIGFTGYCDWVNKINQVTLVKIKSDLDKLTLESDSKDKMDSNDFLLVDDPNAWEIVDDEEPFQGNAQSIASISGSTDISGQSYAYRDMFATQGISLQESKVETPDQPLLVEYRTPPGTALFQANLMDDNNLQFFITNNADGLLVIKDGSIIIGKPPQNPALQVRDFTVQIVEQDQYLNNIRFEQRFTLQIDACSPEMMTTLQGQIIAPLELSYTLLGPSGYIIDRAGNVSATRSFKNSEEKRNTEENQSLLVQLKNRNGNMLIEKNYTLLFVNNRRDLWINLGVRCFNFVHRTQEWKFIELPSVDYCRDYHFSSFLKMHSIYQAGDEMSSVTRSYTAPYHHACYEFIIHHLGNLLSKGRGATKKKAADNAFKKIMKLLAFEQNRYKQSQDFSEIRQICETIDQHEQVYNRMGGIFQPILGQDNIFHAVFGFACSNGTGQVSYQLATNDLNDIKQTLVDRIKNLAPARLKNIFVAKILSNKKDIQSLASLDAEATQQLTAERVKTAWGILERELNKNSAILKFIQLHQPKDNLQKQFHACLQNEEMKLYRYLYSSPTIRIAFQNYCNAFEFNWEKVNLQNAGNEYASSLCSRPLLPYELEVFPNIRNVNGVSLYVRNPLDGCISVEPVIFGSTRNPVAIYLDEENCYRRYLPPNPNVAPVLPRPAFPASLIAEPADHNEEPKPQDKMTGPSLTKRFIHT